MNKKAYIKPTMKMADMATTTILANSVNDVDSGGSEIDYGGGGTGPAHSKVNIWDDYDE